MEQRIYKVTNGDKTHLVQATSQAQALRHVAGNTFIVEIAKTLDVVDLLTAGAKVEKVKYAPEQLNLPE
jgi:hypothetical protein